MIGKEKDPEVKHTGLDSIFATSLVSVTLDGTESYKLAGADKFFAKKDAEVKVNVTLSNFTDTSDTSVDVANGTYGDIKGVTEPIGNSVPTLDSTTKITFKANMVYSGTFTVKATVPAAADLSVNFS